MVVNMHSPYVPYIMNMKSIGSLWLKDVKFDGTYDVTSGSDFDQFQ